MNIPSWLDNILSEPVATATLVLALMTAILAGASFWIIRQNYKFREKDRKERLLNEIIEWATDIVKCKSEQDLHILSVLEFEALINNGYAEEYVKADDKATLFKLFQRYQSVDTRSEYIQSIAETFGKDFQKTIILTGKILHEYLDILNKQVNNKSSEEENSKHWYSLVHSAITVTKEAAKIKTNI